jgi:hypothetical protein
MKPKLKRLIKRLPECKFNVTEAAKKEGYSKSYSETLIHKTIRKYIGVQSDEDIRDEFVRGLDKDVKRFKREKDNSNYLRAKELKSKILALQTDKVITQGSLVIKTEEQTELNRIRQPLLSLTN